MRFPRIPMFVLVGLLLGVAAPAAAAPGICSVPADKLLRRMLLEVPGATRVTRVVEVPAGAEVLVEAFETHINARLEARDPAAGVTLAESGLHRWPPHRLVIPKGVARRVEITVVGIERAHGSVDLAVSRLADRADRRCADFLRAMASGDAAYSRGAMISRAEVEAAPGASEQAYESAVVSYARAARSLDSGAETAQAHLVRASVLMTDTEKPAEAIEDAALAEAQFRMLGDDYGRDLARFIWAYSVTYDAMRLADATEARRRFEMARSTFIEVAASHEQRGERFEQALAIDGLACDDGFLFRYDEAIIEYQRALDILVELQEPDRAVSLRHNVAYFESQFGRYQEALRRHLEILAEGENVKDPLAYLGNLRGAAFHELKLGKYDAALRHYSDAYAYSLRTQSFRDQALALYGLGNAYYTIGNFDEALSYLERSLQLRPEQQRSRDRAFTLRVMANLLGDSGRPHEAIARREEAWRIAVIPPEESRIMLELIGDHINVADFATAKSLIAPLLADRDVLPDPAVRAGATLAGARIALGEGDAARAMRDARAAADYYRSHELVSSEFVARQVEARAACAAGDRDQALDIAHAALQRAEEIRTSSNNPTLRASLWRPLRPAFDFAIDLLARKDSCRGSTPVDPLGALAIAEASRGRALEDFRLRDSVDPDARSKANGRRRELFQQLAGVRQQIETLSMTVSSDDERLRILGIEAARVRREIDLSGGLPGSTRRRSEDLLPLLRARIDAIPAGTAVVEYWIGQDEAFAWLLTRGRAQLVNLGSGPRIDAAARKLYDSMHSWVGGKVEDRIARARDLHDLIIAPLPGELADARTVYFIPDGALHAVPFAALAEGRAPDTRFFIDSHDVAVAPAFLAAASAADRGPVSRNSRALVVVDPVYAHDDARFTRAVSPALSPLMESKNLRGARSWTRLPATAREAATISKLLVPSAVQVLSGFDANRDALLGRDLSRYDILHFATHAVADTQAPQLSALVLSTFDAQGGARVGEVFAGDLADQHLNARLVVLSGCETALGRAEAGEGLLGLRYAAHASGARAVIASLWPVEDTAGARLVDDFYADVISRHQSPVAALSRAARSARARWRDPAMWAAFDVSVAGF